MQAVQETSPAQAVPASATDTPHPPPATPEREREPVTAFFEEALPPNFWDDKGQTAPDTAPAPPDDGLVQTHDASFEAIVEAGAETDVETSYPPSKPLEGELENDPRFKLMTELFPGFISAFEPAGQSGVLGDDGSDDGSDDSSGEGGDGSSDAPLGAAEGLEHEAEDED